MNSNDIHKKNSYSAKIHGQSGALRDLLEKIDAPDMYTLDDIIQFRKNYTAERQKKVNDSIEQVKLQIPRMIAEVSRLTLERDEAIKSKSEKLNQRISCLEIELVRPCQKHNLFVYFYYKIKRWDQGQQLKCFKSKLQRILRRVTNSYGKRIASMENEIKYTENNIETVAKDNISTELRRLDELNNSIEKEKYLVYGAIGEMNVINELKKLPETYHVINDLRMDFHRPIYNRGENDRIFSIQVDHLVVGPTGIFIIETKYWSNKSISSDALFSPVKQVKRAGFALFVILNDAVKSGYIKRLVNNWGERKISPKQIVVSVNSVPHCEFQYVKVLGVEKLNSYVTYGKQEYTAEEIQNLVDFLLNTK